MEARGYLVNASVRVRDNYSPSEIIQGSINLTLKDVSSSSLFESSFGGKILIRDFLDNNSAAYSCNPVDCESTYIGKNGESIKTFSIEPGESKIIGMRVEGEVKGVTDFHFNIRSNAPAACINPVSIDVLDDKDIQYMINYSSNDYSCYSTNGCFSTPDGDVKINDRDYCNKVYLRPAPAYRIGAIVKKSGSDNLVMKLMGIDSNNASIYLENGECSLPEPAYTNWTEVSCVVPYTIDKVGEYYVCIYSKEGIGNYSIQYEEKEPVCGYYDYIEENYTVDYNLFAKASGYGGFNSIVFDQESQNVNSLSLIDYIYGYLENRYQGKCTDGCIIPITFTAGVKQDITVSDAYLAYSSNVGPKETREMYDVEKGDPLINVDSQKLDIARAKFRVPSSYGNYSLILSISGVPILNQKIIVKKVPIVYFVYPTTAPQSVKTRFYVSAKSPENKSIVKYEWYFGDNTTGISETNATEHVYSKIGIYTMEVRAVDSDGNSGSKTFTIIVGSAREAVNQSIRELKTRLASITSNISGLWYKSSIEERIKLSENEKLLDEAQRSFIAAKTEEDYSKIVAKIESISIPKFIMVGDSINIPFIFDIKSMNFNYLEELGAGKIAEDEIEDYRNAIGAWFYDIESSKEYRNVYAYYDNLEAIGTYFKIDAGQEGDMFLVIDRPIEHIQFLEDYEAVNLGGATGIAFNGRQSFTFFIKGSVDPVKLNMYIAPELDTLEIGINPEPCNYNDVCEKYLGETSSNCKGDCPPRKLTAFYIILLLIAAFIAYTFIQEWYRKRYESHLFKNKTDVYNLVNFVGNAMKQGLSKDDISKKLKESGWNGEQISYIFKKIEGKRIGLPGFNILEILEKRRMKRFNNKQNIAMKGKQPIMPGPGRRAFPYRSTDVK